LIDSAGPLDAEALALMAGLDPDGSSGLMGKLSEAFERTAARLELELQAALQAGPDLERLRRAAHTLKSSSANLAALQLAAQCQQLEALCQRGDDVGAQIATAQVMALLVDARHAIRQLA
jgi:histidine phosphotransfer protein HptB